MGRQMLFGKKPKWNIFELWMMLMCKNESTIKSEWHIYKAFTKLLIAMGVTEPKLNNYFLKCWWGVRKDIFEDADDSQEDPEMKQRMYKINMVRKFRYGLNWILKSKDHLWNITENKTASFIKSELSRQVLIEGCVVHQLTFGLLEHILGSLKSQSFKQ